MYKLLVSRVGLFSKILGANNEFDLIRSLSDILNIIEIESVISRDKMIVVRTNDFALEIRGTEESLKVVMEYIQDRMIEVF